jgi:hypothetical protein
MTCTGAFTAAFTAAFTTALLLLYCCFTAADSLLGEMCSEYARQMTCTGDVQEHVRLMSYALCLMPYALCLMFSRDVQRV